MLLFIQHTSAISPIRLEYHNIGFYHLSNFGEDFFWYFFVPVDNIIKAQEHTTK